MKEFARSEWQRAGRAKSSRDFASVQQSAALQLHEIVEYSNRVANQLANAFGVNFHEPVLKNGISRMILPGANQTQDESKDVAL